MNKRKAAISPHHNSQQNLDSVSIVASSPPTIQWQSHKRLNQAIRRQQLSKILEILEWYGFGGDLGTFMLSQLQDSSVRRAAK